MACLSWHPIVCMHEHKYHRYRFPSKPSFHWSSDASWVHASAIQFFPLTNHIFMCVLIASLCAPVSATLTSTKSGYQNTTKITLSTIFRTADPSSAEDRMTDLWLVAITCARVRLIFSRVPWLNQSMSFTALPFSTVALWYSLHSTYSRNLLMIADDSLHFTNKEHQSVKMKWQSLHMVWFRLAVHSKGQAPHVTFQIGSRSQEGV